MWFYARMVKRMTGQKVRRVNLGTDPPNFEQQPIYYTNEAERKSFNALNENIRSLYPEGISDSECEAVTRNLVGFAKLVLQIKREQDQKEAEARNTQEQTS